ncbi:glycosyltransferase family 2 protein [Pedobacter sp. KLB.chiD]|uniref:glycosyltransferase family 2 protein n=1 Tax=Pedobacter sp. KLB.chiD TaxID=3387402 RepID=UPI00399BB7EB
MHKKISVVIPTYNRLNLLFNCLDALNKQTLPGCDFEVIVVNDGPDNEMIESLSRQKNNYRFQLFPRYTAEKKGPAAARNLGWLTASAPLVAFTDDDCLPHTDWLKGFLDQHHSRELAAYSGKTVVPLYSHPTDFALNTSRLSEADFITANCACTKAALFKTGGFDERFAMAWREDSDLEFKLMQASIPIFRNEAAVVVHPVREASWGVSLKEQCKGIYDVLLFKKYPELYRQKIQRSPIWTYYLIVVFALLSLYTLFLGYHRASKWSVLVMLFLITCFALKRLQKTSRSAVHVAEMLITSAIIPFLSVYFRICGVIRYKKLLF